MNLYGWFWFVCDLVFCCFGFCWFDYFALVDMFADS